MLAIPFFSYSQKASKTEGFKIKPIQMITQLPNMMYKGVENPVKMLITGVNMEEFSLMCEGGEIVKSKAKNDTIYVLPSKSDTVRTLTLSMYHKKKLIHEQLYHLKKLPIPVVTFAGVSVSGYLTKSRVLASLGLVCSTGGLEKLFDELKAKVVGYTVTIQSRGTEVSCIVIGNKITPEVKEIFNRLKSGDKIYFEDIKTITATGITNKTALKIQIL